MGGINLAKLKNDCAFWRDKGLKIKEIFFYHVSLLLTAL